MNIYPGQIINYSEMQNIYTASASAYMWNNLLGSMGMANLGYVGHHPTPNAAIPFQSIVYQPIIERAPEVQAKPKITRTTTALELIEKLSRQEKVIQGEKMVCQEKTLAAVDLCHF